MTAPEPKTPAPGSDEAVKQGCICARIDNHYGRGYRGNPGEYVQRPDCPVHGRREVGMRERKPIIDRIRDAFGEDEFELSYHTLADRVFPKEQFPRAWRYSSNGGPPGCYMALSAAIRRYKVPSRYDRFDQRHILRPDMSSAGRAALAAPQDGEG